MSIIIVAELSIKPGRMDDLKTFMAEIISDTRSFDGCKQIDICTNPEDENSIVLVEKWDSKEHYEKYHHWRSETGDLGKFRELFAGPPKRQFLDITDI